MQIALDDLIEAQIEQAGHQLDQGDPLAIPLAPEIGAGRLGFAAIAHRLEDGRRVAFPGRGKPIALGIRLAIEDRCENLAIGIELAEDLDFLIDPL